MERLEMTKQNKTKKKKKSDGAMTKRFTIALIWL